MRFLLGGYGTDMDGIAAGIGMLVAGDAEAGSAGGPLAFTGEVAAASSPSWLSAHPTLDVVYAALEHVGAVQAFRRTGEESWMPLGDPVETGEATCHVAVAPDGASLLASCWGDGRVVMMKTDAAGRPHAPIVAPAAVDPYGDGHGAGDPLGADVELGAGGGAGDIDLAAAARALREAAGDEYAHLVPAYDEPDGDAGAPASTLRAPHAHQALFLPNGQVVTTDMGFDLVRFWTRGANGLRARQQVVLPRGSGPRHMVWHPSGHLYVVAELSREVFALAFEPSVGVAGTWRIVGGSSLGPTLSGDTAAELAMSRDGEFLYAGVRGSNTISTVRVRGAGETLAPVALVDSGVDWPRHHVIVRDTLVVAGQRSDGVASLTLDLRTGVPGRVRHRAAAPSPTCILPVA